MTDDEEKPEEGGDDGNPPAPQGADFKQVVRVLALAVGVAAATIFFVFLFSQLFLPFVVLFEGGGVDYAVSCGKYTDGIDRELLLSDNITGYEDIPENQKKNLSNETRESLKELPDSFYNNTISFNSLSDNQKTIFKEKALNDTLRSFNRPLNEVVFYQGAVYYCESDSRQSGA